MILDILVFALGFLAAGLLALAVLPAVWRRAMRLSGERLSRLVPLSPEEVAADRDHLRAAHAVDLRRVEQKLERAEVERGTLMAEVSRREDRIAELARTGARLEADLAAQTADGAELRRHLAAQEAEAGTAQLALHDASGLAEKRWLETVDLKLEIQRLAGQTDRDRATVAALETRLLGATTRADDLARDLAAARQTPPPQATDSSSDVSAAADAATRALGEARRREIEHLTHELDFAHEQAASAERRAAEAAREAARVGAERDALAVDLASLRAKAADEPGDDLDGLRAALNRLADDVMKLGRAPEPAAGAGRDPEDARPAQDALEDARPAQNALEGARPAHQGGETPPLP